MTAPSLSFAVESVCSLGLLAPHRERTASMRQSFEERTGAFGPDDAWFETRSRAFWDDALTRQGFARHVMAELPEGARPWAMAFEHSHRGLFCASLTMGRRLVTDLWSGAEFLVDEVDEAMRTALDAPAGPFDGRLVALANPIRVGLLPGAVFHPLDAAEPIEDILRAAREQAMATDDVLDALLRMDLSLRSLARVKVSYAYQTRALVRPG